MSDLIQAATTIREIAVKLKGFELAAAALERVGSFEQAEAEAKERAAEAMTAAAEAVADRDSAQREAEQIRADFVSMRAAAQEESERILAAAREQADGIVAAANATSEQIIAAARVEAGGIVDNGKLSAAEHMKKVLAEVYGAEERLAELTAKVAEVERANLIAANALETTEARLAKAREQIASLFDS